MIIGWRSFKIDIEKYFAILVILFYSELLAFQSLFAMSEGEGQVLSPQTVNNPLSPILRLIQHGTFLIAVSLLLLRWRRSLKVVSSNIYIWGLLVFIFTSFLWSDFPILTQRNTISLIETTLFGLYFASRFDLKEQLNILAIGSSIFVIVSLLFSLVLPGSATEMGVHIGAWRGPLIQKNLFARVLVLFSLITYIHKPKGQLGKAVRWGTLALGIFLIVLSKSTSALIILACMFGFLMCQKLFFWAFSRSLMLFTPIICGSLLVTIIPLLLVLGNIEETLTLTGKDITLSGRTELWNALIVKISERPLLGYGYNGFWKGIFGESAYVGKVFGNTYLPPHSHNGFFEITLAFGLIGLGLFAFNFLWNARYALLLPIAVPTNESQWPLAYLMFLILYNFTESTLVEHNSIFWMLFIALTFSQSSAHILGAGHVKKGAA